MGCRPGSSTSPSKGGVPVHGVDAVRQVPRARACCKASRPSTVEWLYRTVSVDAGALEQARRLLHAGVDLLVKDDRVPRGHEGRQRGEVAEVVEGRMAGRPNMRDSFDSSSS